MRLLTSRSCATFTSFFCGTFFVSLEIECLRLASVAKWALAKQRMRTSRNQNTFERRYLDTRNAGPFYLHQSQQTLFLHLLGLTLRKWSKGQLRLQSLMDFLQQERQRFDPAIPGRQLDPEVADTFRRFGLEMSLKHPEKRPRARASFSELFYFCSKMLAVLPEKRIWYTEIHFGWSTINSFMLRCKKMTGAKIRLTPFDLVASRPIKGLVEFGWIFQDTNWSLVGVLCWPHMAARDEGKRDCTFCI